MLPPELRALIDGTVEAVKDKPQALGWFVGQVMKATGGKANPKLVGGLLRKKLKG